MKIRKTAFVFLALIIAVAGWFFVSPLFIDNVVDEPAVGEIPTKEQVSAMDPAVRAAMMKKLMAQAAGTETEIDEPMDRSMGETPLVVATGRFKDADAIHKGSGNASLYRLNNGRHVIRLEDFQVTNGPALVVLLARALDPKSADEVRRGYVKLDDLKGNIGNQNYELPANIDAGAYRSVVIWCDLFDVLFSAATLNAT